MERIQLYVIPAIASALVIGTIVLVPATSEASECDSFTADSGDNIAIVGEIYIWNTALGDYIPLSPGGTSIVCWQDSSGNWNDFYPACNGSWGAGDWLSMYGQAGDDTITIHPASGPLFQCPGLAGNMRVGPSHTGWSWHLRAEGGAGADEIHLSEEADRAWSNTSASTDDGADDVLCGYAGADKLFGDADDENDTECLHGGASANDECSGVGFGADFCSTSTGCETDLSCEAGSCVTSHDFFNAECTGPPDLSDLVN